MQKKYIKKSSKQLYTHKRIKLSEDTIILPDGTESEYLLYDNLPDVVCIIVINDKNQILVNHEYNYPTDEYIYQLPAGVIEYGEEPSVGAARELLEETGILATKLNMIGSVPYNHRRSKAVHYFYVAAEFSESRHKRESEELLTNHWIDIDEFSKMVACSEIKHIGSVAAWGMYISQKLTNK